MSPRGAVCRARGGSLLDLPHPLGRQIDQRALEPPRRSASTAGGARAQAISKLANVSFGSGTGAWVRDGDLILNVAGQNSERPFGSMQLLKDRVVAGPA